MLSAARCRQNGPARAERRRWAAIAEQNPLCSARSIRYHSIFAHRVSPPHRPESLVEAVQHGGKSDSDAVWVGRPFGVLANERSDSLGEFIYVGLTES